MTQCWTSTGRTLLLSLLLLPLLLVVVGNLGGKYTLLKGIFSVGVARYWARRIGNEILVLISNHVLRRPLRRAKKGCRGMVEKLPVP